MDHFDTFKMEPSGSEVVEFSLDDDGQEMEIIQSGSIFPTSQTSTQMPKAPRRSTTGRSRVEILPNDDERVVRAGNDFSKIEHRI